MQRSSAVAMGVVAYFAAVNLTAQSSAANDVFVVRADFENEQVVRDVLAVATEAQAIVAHELGVRSFDGPLTIHLYRDVTGYEAADRRYTGGRFSSNRAFSTRRDLSAHLVWEPDGPASRLQRFGVPEQMRRLVAHEATHLLLYTSCPSHGRFQPRWLTEGLSQWVEEQVVATEDVAPWVSHDRYTVRLVLAGDRAPTVSGLSLDVDFGIGPGPRYSCERLFFQWLRQRHADRLGPLLRSLPRRPATAALSRVLRAELLRDGAWRAWDRDFRRFVSGQAAPWIEPVRSLSRVEGGYLQVSVQGRRALAWCTRELPEELRLRARVELLAHGAKAVAAHLLVGGAESEALAVQLRSDGAVALSRWNREDGPFDDLVVCGAGLRTGKGFTVDVSADAGGVVVAIDGREVLRHGEPLGGEPLGGEPLGVGRVGFGVAPGSAVLWQSLETFKDGAWRVLPGESGPDDSTGDDSDDDDSAAGGPSVDGQSGQGAAGEPSPDKEQ